VAHQDGAETMVAASNPVALAVVRSASSEEDVLLARKKVAGKKILARPWLMPFNGGTTWSSGGGMGVATRRKRTWGGHGSMVGWRCRPATPKAGGRGQAALRHARSAPEIGDAGSLTSGLGATVTGGGSLNWG
jgi:hypothetical protein